MIIECLQRRPGGSEVSVGRSTYKFMPPPKDNDGPHTAEVTDKRHIKRLLSITAGFCVAGTAPNTKELVEARNEAILDELLQEKDSLPPADQGPLVDGLSEEDEAFDVPSSDPLLEGKMAKPGEFEESTRVVAFLNRPAGQVAQDLSILKLGVEEISVLRGAEMANKARKGVVEMLDKLIGESGE